jgi:hypothetical protein
MGLKVASILIGLVGFAHLVRLLTEVTVTVAGRQIPMWMSGVAVVVSALLSAWLWRLTLPVKTPAPQETEHPHDATPLVS